MRDYTFTRAAVTAILEHWHSYEWSVQGFGMLRTYLDAGKKYRLNIWHGSLAGLDVSIIHDHPWDFTSVVLGGTFTNIRYHVCSPMTGMSCGDPEGMLFYRQRIKTGEGGGPDGPMETVALRADRPEVVQPGYVYNQRAEEIHASFYVDGSVTLNERWKRPDSEHANVFWPFGQEWVDAEPRKATTKECTRVIDAALVRMREKLHG